MESAVIDSRHTPRAVAAATMPPHYNRSSGLVTPQAPR
jgi:hypothetical protein